MLLILFIAYSLFILLTIIILSSKYYYNSFNFFGNGIQIHIAFKGKENKALLQINSTYSPSSDITKCFKEISCFDYNRIGSKGAFISGTIHNVILKNI